MSPTHYSGFLSAPVLLVLVLLGLSVAVRFMS